MTYGSKMPRAPKRSTPRWVRLAQGRAIVKADAKRAVERAAKERDPKPREPEPEPESA